MTPSHALQIKMVIAEMPKEGSCDFDIEPRTPTVRGSFHTAASVGGLFHFRRVHDVGSWHEPDVPARSPEVCFQG